MKVVNENEEVEKIGLTLEEDEILLVDPKGQHISKVSTKQIVKKALEEKTLRFRIKEAVQVKLNRDEEKKLPDLKELVFDTHLLLYGKRAHEVKYVGHVCPFCGMEVDEQGYCCCNTGTD
ncbi:Sulfolobus mercury resistance protein, MerI [Sulfolobus acidocaldarius SUSAZ]|nr:Sulfolobus mercury resistance protein, MerI [Sulfolobus acidocaldarius SUSAZ]